MRLREKIIGLGLILVALGSGDASASFDEFADQFSPTNIELRARHIMLTIKGELELEFHDLEGEGGPGKDSMTDTRTIGTRSPFVEIDSFWLALRIGLSPEVGVFSFLDFSTRGASVGSVWFDVRDRAPGWLEHHLEAGYNSPIVKIDRRTERYPLIASSYWRYPELHLAYEAIFLPHPRVRIELGGSLAMMRPLGFSGVQDSTAQPGTINILVSAPASVFSGNGPVGGGRLRVDAFGAFVDAFGFLGALAAQSGTDILRAGFSSYRNLPSYPSNEDGGGDFFWYGGRVGYEDYGVLALVEAIASKEDLIERWGGYAQLSYRIEPFDQAVFFHRFEPLVRYEVYRVLDSTTPLGTTGRALRSPAPIDAVTWDHDILTIAMIIAAYRDLILLRAEYYFIDERNGVSALDVEEAPFRNNELMIQAELRF